MIHQEMNPTVEELLEWIKTGRKKQNASKKVISKYFSII
jgi:hypothetical protein